MESNPVKLDKRLAILEEVLEAIRSWDKTYDMGIAIIESVGLSLEDLKTINTSIATSSGSTPFDEVYRDKMSLVVEEYGGLLDKLEIERKELLKLIKETRLKEQVKHSYILKDKDSIFIDKDL